MTPACRSDLLAVTCFRDLSIDGETQLNLARYNENHWSFGLDIKVVWLTAKKIVRPRDAGSKRALDNARVQRQLSFGGNAVRKLIIWGASGHGKVVLETARATGLFSEIVFVDDSCASPGGRFCDCELLPASKGLEALKASGHNCLVVAIGNNHDRERCFQEGIDRRLDLAALIHPAAILSASARIGSGTVVMPRVVVNADAVIGHNCILNTGVIVEHDCHIGDHVHLAPGVILGGGVTVEPYSLLGIGTIALPGTRIGAGAVVGAGAVILDSVPPGATSVGIPARVLSNISR